MVSPAYNPLLPEIWLQIFPLLSSKVLFKVTLTCQAFRVMAQPLLFQSLNIDISILRFQRQEPAQSSLMPYANEMERNKQRLTFYASSRVAPSVISCKISHWNLEWPPFLDSGVGDGDVVLDKFFQVLPKFVNLHKLFCFFIPFTDTGLRQLHLLRNLRELSVEKCCITAVRPPPAAMRVDYLSWTQHDQLTAGDLSHSSSDMQWFSIIEPRSALAIALRNIRDLRAVKNCLGERHMQHCLQSLSVPLTDEIPRLLVDVFKIHHCAATLQSLIFHDTFSPITLDVAGLPAISMRSLIKYHGPYELLRVFVPSYAFRRFTLLDVTDPRRPYNPGEVINILLDLHTRGFATQLEALTIRVTHITPHLLNSICTLLVHLSDLDIHSSTYAAQDDAYTSKTIIPALAMLSHPSGLRTLALWFNYPADLPDCYPFHPERDIMFKDHLCKKWPDFEMLRLQGQGLNYFWSRDKYGTEIVHGNDETGIIDATSGPDALDGAARMNDIEQHIAEELDILLNLVVPPPLPRTLDHRLVGSSFHSLSDNFVRALCLLKLASKWGLREYITQCVLRLKSLDDELWAMPNIQIVK